MGTYGCGYWIGLFIYGLTICYDYTWLPEDWLLREARSLLGFLLTVGAPIKFILCALSKISFNFCFKAT